MLQLIADLRTYLQASAAPAGNCLLVRWACLSAALFSVDCASCMPAGSGPSLSRAQYASLVWSNSLAPAPEGPTSWGRMLPLCLDGLLTAPCRPPASRTSLLQDKCVCPASSLLQDKCEPPVYVSDRRLVKAVALMQVGSRVCCTWQGQVVWSGSQWQGICRRRSKHSMRGGMWMGLRPMCLPLPFACTPCTRSATSHSPTPSQFPQVAAYTSGRSRVSEYDCLLLRHILWQRPDEAERIYDWLLKWVASASFQYTFLVGIDLLNGGAAMHLRLAAQVGGWLNHLGGKCFGIFILDGGGVETHLRLAAQVGGLLIGLNWGWLLAVWKCGLWWVGAHLQLARHVGA